MGIISTFFNNSDNISKGYSRVLHGNSYTVVLDLDSNVILYTSGVTDMTPLIDKYLIKKGISKDSVQINKVGMRKKDIFLKTEELKQLCIVDKEVMLKADVKELMKTKKLKADKRNAFMVGLDKYTTI